MTNRRWVLAVGSALACAAVSASCARTDMPSVVVTADPRPPEATAVSPTSVLTADPLIGGGVPIDVEMFFDYPRYLWHVRRLSVATTNLGDEPITISSIAVRADHFEPLAAESKRTVIAPGQRVDVQVDFGALVACSSSDDLAAAVAVTFTKGDGPPVEHLVRLDPAPLDEIRDRECAEQRVEDAASIAVSAQRSIDGPTMETSIEIVRRRGVPVIEVSSLSGSVILALVPVADSEPLLRIDPDRTRADLPIRIEVTRCDPHVVSQSSRTFDLAVFVSVDDAEAHRYQLEIDPRLQSDLQSLIDACQALVAD
ncbi:hypothetical protein [Ilumatobacter fluminis]|uniref:hypothetical protein n=1 Tax=Ilumatobacter fluminis TaxID=467091 RepID=UPI00105DF4B9|nr:hypothetical protein [Ilumatobacter fluminis]